MIRSKKTTDRNSIVIPLTHQYVATAKRSSQTPAIVVSITPSSHAWIVAP